MPINLFKTVKAAVTTIEAAKLYGLEVNRAGMVCCPFHEDHTPIPPRLFKQAARLNRQKEKLVQLLSELTPLNAKKKAAEIAVILEEYIPGVEELMTKTKKANRAAKDLRIELSHVKKEMDGSKPSVLRQLELEQKVQKLDDLQSMVDALQQTLDTIPPDVLAVYDKSQTERKDTMNRG